MSAARTACRNSTMTLSGLLPVLMGSRIGPLGVKLGDRGQVAGQRRDAVQRRTGGLDHLAGGRHLDGDDGGQKNAWTRNTVFMAWNLLHMARLLKDAGGIPAYSNSTRDWDLPDPDSPNPEHRA